MKNFDDISGLIDRYLHGELSGEELANFEEEMAKDSALAEEVAFRASLLEVAQKVGREELKKKILSIDEELGSISEPATSTRIKPLWIALGIAASFLILLIIGLRISSDQQLEYESYALNQVDKEYYIIPTTRGDREIALKMEELKKAIASKSFAKAIEVLDANPEIVEKRPEKYLLYKGTFLLELEQYEAAEAIFSDIAQKESDFRDEAAYWYILSALKRKDFQLCRQRLMPILEDQQFKYLEQAKKLKAQLDAQS